MPKRHIYLLFIIIFVSLLCYFHSDRYTHSLDYLMRMLETRALDPVYKRDLFDGALSGMLNTLDDNSSYFLPKLYKEIDESLRQEISGGIGAVFQVNEETGKAVISFTLPNTPAREAGLMPGDEIILVGDMKVEGLSQNKIREHLIGEVGTPVALEIFRPSTSQTLQFSVIRSRIRLETVEGLKRSKTGTWEFFLPPFSEEDIKTVLVRGKEKAEVSQEAVISGEGRDLSEKFLAQRKIAYVRVTSFGEHTAEELKNTLLMLQKRGMEGLILDLRDNYGGLLDAANNVCDLFLEKGEIIVTTRGRNQQILKEVRASGRKVFDSRIPMAVLINGNSASASEIVAACLQDHSREGKLNVVCVGVRSFGKGTVQELIALGPLPDDHRVVRENMEGTEEFSTQSWEGWHRLWKASPRAAIRITVASYWRPSGKNIHRFRRGEEIAGEDEDWGVLPDDGMEVDFPRTARGKVLSSFSKKYEEFFSKCYYGTLTPEELKNIYKIDPQLKKAVWWEYENISPRKEPSSDEKIL
ncbi:MAG: S41 family peptidase [Planctomycetia bacterium]|nr:S41 family peptidase [Planctomycetia bacterium]